jgi:hypothetical protein
VPAGYVFSIWGLIYLGLLAYALYQLRPSSQDEQRLARIDWWFPLSCAANIGWLFLWHYEQFPLTLPAMFGLLACLLLIYTRLGIGIAPTSRLSFWTVNATFSLYLGWISVASIANVGQVLDFMGWDGWGIAPEMWTLTMLIVAAGLTTLMAIMRGDIIYLLVIIWATIGIAIKQSPTPIVAITAWSVAGYAAFMLLIAYIRRRRPSEVMAD